MLKLVVLVLFLLLGVFLPFGMGEVAETEDAVAIRRAEVGKGGEQPHVVFCSLL